MPPARRRPPAEDVEREQWADVDAQEPALSIDAASDEDASGNVGLSGEVADNLRVSRVQWSNDRGGNGSAALTLSGDHTRGTWSVPSVQLLHGDNRITITASDAAGHEASTTIVLSRGNGAGAAEREAALAVSSTSTRVLGTATLQPIVDPNTAGMAEAFAYNAVATGTAQRLYFYLDAEQHGDAESWPA